MTKEKRAQMHGQLYWQRALNYPAKFSSSAHLRKVDQRLRENLADVLGDSGNNETKIKVLLMKNAEFILRGTDRMRSAV